MDFLIRHETSSYLRVQSRKGFFSRTQAQALRAALPRISGVSRVRLYPASGGIALTYSGDREEVLQAYAGSLVEEGRLDPAIATDMGDSYFLACFSTMEEVLAFYDRVLEEQ